MRIENSRWICIFIYRNRQDYFHEVVMDERRREKG
jgi:hypothetical protein